MYQNSRLRRPQPQPKKLGTPKILFVAAILIAIAVVIAGGYLMTKNKGKTENTNKTSEKANSFDKSRYSITDPTSPWVVVNKKRQLSPKDYDPADLRTPSMEVESSDMQVNSQTAAALETLASAAAKEDVNLILASAYRSYEMQSTIYNSEVRGFGQAQADRESARPGHSEHQTGWAADLGAANGKCEIQACFADTSEGKWLAANAYKYGFIIRYAEGKEHITGYMHEPWHLRYVGVNLSIEMHNQKIQTLEEFFNLAAAPTY